jgi:hypothetical protein
VGLRIGDVAIRAAAITVIHGADKDLLATAFVLAASAAISVPIAVAGRRPEAAAAVAALIARALLEEALAGFLLRVPLVVGSGRGRGGAVGRSASGSAILRRRAVLLAFALGAFVAAAATPAMALSRTLWVLSLLVLGLRRPV